MSRKRRVLIVIGHARTTSLCHHLTGIVRETLGGHGAEVRIHDLLADGFDPCLRMDPDEPFALPPTEEEDPLAHRYCEDVKWADTYVFIHPVYWFAPPGILKGWIDRIFVEGVAVHQPEDGPTQGILQGRSALVVQTFGAPKVVDKVVFRNLAEAFWRRAVFFATGIKRIKRFAIYSVDTQSKAKMMAHEKRLRRTVSSLVE